MQRLLLILLAIPFVVLLISWPLSYRRSHGWTLTFHQKYGVWCDHGFVEFRHGTRTGLVRATDGKPSIISQPYDDQHPLQVPRQFQFPPIRWDSRGSVLSFSPWRPIQFASILSGGSYLDPKLGYVEFGDKMMVYATPYWLIALLLTGLLAWQAVRFYRSRSSHRAGQCPRCGYDLRATPERCPECGAVPAGSPNL